MNNEKFLDEFVVGVINSMTNELSKEQLSKLKNILYIKLNGYKVEKKCVDIVPYDMTNSKLLDVFIATKRIEGKSEKTLDRYKDILRMMIDGIGYNIKDITTNDLRCYLANYKEYRKVCDNTLDGMRRIITSFFGWLKKEGYIEDDPSARLEKIKAKAKVKKVITDEELELIRMHCKTDRDIAMIDLFYASGIRVSELSGLNISDVDFERKEIVVKGKGNKERKVYFNGSTKIRLIKYLSTRSDNNEALFVTLTKSKTTSEPRRFNIKAIESRINTIAKSAGLHHVHPHKFRHKFATDMLRKQMPINKISKMLGHEKIETTQIYAKTSDEDIRNTYLQLVG